MLSFVFFGVRFREWFATENTGPTPHTKVTDFHSWLCGNADMVRLQLLFDVQHANEVFQGLQNIQASVAAIFVHGKQPGRAKPIVHFVYDKLRDLHVMLQQYADSNKLRSGTEPQPTRKNRVGWFQYNVSVWRTHLLDIMKAASQKQESTRT